MKRLALLFLGLASPSTAETARVYSGEHGDFTRLVIELPAATEWLLGRTEDGYAFATRGPDQPEYDLAGVWQRIARTRATDIATDPGTGALRLSLGCECHIFPFEYRPGVVVLDIKPGKAPATSEFERAFESGKPTGPAAYQMPFAGSAAKYSWLDTRISPDSSEASQVPQLPLPLSTGGVSLDPLRSELLEQLARGAADGIVDLGLPLRSRKTSGPKRDDLPWSGIRIGEQPGIAIGRPATPDDGIGPASSCTDDALLDIAAWAETGSASDMLASARSGMYGEFDIVDPEAVLHAVRLHLHLGFGAEASQLAELVTDGPDAQTLALYRSMGRILDGEPDPGAPFASMLDCDGPAALWAALARDRLPRGPGVNRAAILRAFQALPPHLRSHLGPGLADRFLAIDDPDAARIVRDAMARTPHIEAKTIALLDATNDLHVGNTDAAMRHAAEAVALDGNQASSLVTLVEAHFRELQPVAADVPEALRSLRGEIGATDLGAQVDRAIVLSLALSGQADAAFATRDMTDETLADLWQVAASRADDDSFLRHAVLPAGTSPPRLAPGLDLTIANRLLGLGFADAALGWIGKFTPSDPLERRLAAAKASLGVGDARAAIALLDGASDTESEAVRAQALLQLDDIPAAARALIAAGRPQDATRVELWSGMAPSPGAEVPETWKDPALSPLAVAPESGVGLLGRATATVDASLASRTAIEALLGSVPRP